MRISPLLLMPRLLTPCLVMALLLMSGLLLPGAAQAHAILIDSQPAARGVAAPGTERIVLRFNSRVAARAWRCGPAVESRCCT